MNMIVLQKSAGGESTRQQAGRHRATAQRGSSLVLAIFVMVLVSGMGLSLLFVAQTEQQMSQADVRAKKSFYLAEAGVEDGRITVHMPGVTLSDQLATAAGANGVVDFDVQSLVPVYDTSGNLTGFTGYGDDVPVRGITSLGDGWYATFLSNDPSEGISTTVDGNNRVLVTGIGVTRNRSMEMAQAIVRFRFPIPPASITLLGPNPSFDGGTSDSKLYTGNDGDGHCPSGDPSLAVPAVGVIGSAAETAAESGVFKDSTYTQGTESGFDTVDDLTLLPSLDPIFTDCAALISFVGELRGAADVRGDASTPLDQLGTPSNPKIVFIDDDYEITGSILGAGMLVVTGQLILDGQAEWQGPIFVVGQGDFDRSGSGNGVVSGGMIVANVEGPDQTLFTSDDCSGPDGILGNSDDGMAESIFNTSGGGAGTFGYCSTYIEQMKTLLPLRIVSFRQT